MTPDMSRAAVMSRLKRVSRLRRQGLAFAKAKPVTPGRPTTAAGR
jgi:hypothetical protein